MGEVRELHQISDVIFAGRPASRLSGSGTTTLRRVVNLRDVGSTISASENLDEVHAPMSSETDRLALKPGDVVITARGSSIRAAVVEPQHEGALLGANLVAVRLIDANPVLIMAYLRHPAVQKALLAEFAGSTTSGFSVESLRRLEVRLPDEPEATLLADLVSAVDNFASHVVAAAELRREAVLGAVFARMNAAGGHER